jgi:hypothetical protein
MSAPPLPDDPASFIGSLLAARTGSLNRTKRLKFAVSQAAAAGHEAVETAACRALIDELKVGGVDLSSYKWATSMEGAKRLGAGYSLDDQWVTSTEQAVAATEKACSQAPMALARFKAAHGDPEGALQTLRKVKERVVDSAVALEALPMAFGCDLSKTPPRSFINDCCARLLRGSLGEGLDPSSRAHAQCCDALMALCASEYANAARKMADVCANDLGERFSDVILARDVGLCGALCAVAALGRAELQSALLHRASFRPFLEAAPVAGQIARDFHAGRYSSVLKQLRALEPLLYYDVHLAPHRRSLCEAIRTNCICNYVKPFGRLDLRKMAAAFETEVEVLETEVGALVVGGKVVARIDSAEKQLIATVANRRQAGYHKATQEGDSLVEDANLMILRANLTAQQFLSAPPMNEREEMIARSQAAEVSQAMADQEQMQLAQALSQSTLDS